ncbi:hypothetical protein [Nocardia sp. NPDC059239]|uniref:hypothetical protein n=1 Tax=Nocardia sp. NPDC059239 TaxID=3346785 RepID=UPI0036AC01EC
MLRRHLDTHFDPANVVYPGFEWTEPELHEQSIVHWQPWTIRSLLLEQRYMPKSDLLALFRRRGIEPPLLYAHGFSHANCGDACVRGGQAWEAEKNATRSLLGKGVSILSRTHRRDPETVVASEFRQPIQQPAMFDADDCGACSCTDTYGTRTNSA